MDFQGEFETHLTVLLHRPERLAELRQWALANGLKFSHIVLERGSCTSQPMLTGRGQGSLGTELARARQLVQRLEADGFAVSRTKLEACLQNRDVPQSDEEASHSHASRYFEHHVKLLMDAAADLTRLTALALRHAAHLSRNAFLVRSDGLHERFVTQRWRLVGRATAQQRLNALLDDLAKVNQHVLEVEQEFVVHDSNTAIDRGWIEGED